MKLRKIILLSLGMALSAAGAGTALAATFSRTSASSSGSGIYDQAIYLYWDQDSSASAALDSMTSVGTDPQYRYLEVSPKSSKTVEGTVSVTFTLAAYQAGAEAGKTAVTKGITVKVYEIDNEATASDFTTYISGDPLFTITTSDATKTATFEIEENTSEGVHETQQKYAIAVTYSPDGLGADEQVSATLSMSQSFAASQA